MAVYSFHRVLVWDNLGGTVRVARNVRVDVLDPNTGALPAGLTQGGQAVTYLTTDSAGLVEFEATVPTVEFISPNGLVQRVTSQDALEAAAGYTVSEDAAIAGSINANGSASQAAVASRIDAHLGGDATGLVTAVAGKVGKGDLVLNVRDYGAKGDGTTNDTAAIQAALDAGAAFGGRRVHVPAGTYSVNEIRIPANTTLAGEGVGATTLVARNSQYAILSSGAVLPSVRDATLTVMAKPGDSTLAVNSTAPFTAGDWILLVDDSVPDTAYPTRLAGELLQVASVDSATQLTITIKDKDGNAAPGVRGSFAATGMGAYLTDKNARLYRLNMRRNVGVESLTLRNPNPGTGSVFGISLGLTVGARVRDVEIAGMDGDGISLNTSHGATVDGCWIHDLTDDSTNNRYGYGVEVVGATQHVVISNCYFERVRHAVTTNGTDLGGIPSHITVSNCRAHRATGAAFDTHGTGAYITFVGCVATDTVAWGFQARARYVSFISCEAIRPRLDGFLITTSGTTGVGCRVQSCVVRGSQRFGIDVSPGVRDVEIADTSITETAQQGIRVNRAATDVKIVRPRIYNACRTSGSQGIVTAGSSGTLTGLVVVGGTFAQTLAGGFTVAIQLADANVTGAIVADNRGWGLTGTFLTDAGAGTVKENNKLYGAP